MVKLLQLLLKTILLSITVYVAYNILIPYCAGMINANGIIWLDWVNYAVGPYITLLQCVVITAILLPLCHKTA